MKKIKLLDCTLRDGGSLNGWNFGYENIIEILRCLNDSNIEIAEIGFLQDNINSSLDKTISTDTELFDKLLSQIKNKKFKTAVMINLCKYNTDYLKQKSQTLIDEIRLMFKKEDLDAALNYGLKIKEKGYTLSFNPVSITSYTNEEIKKLFKVANVVQPEIVYIVDTYGLMYEDETIKKFYMFDNELNEKIQIGYHSHNNLQLAFSNSIEIINNISNRNIVIDGSLYGMGKRAGNANTELLAAYLNKTIGSTKYDINKLNDTIESTILPLHDKFDWGYSISHYIAAINKCHSDYVTYLKNEMHISFSEINRILKCIPDDKKLTFDKNCLNYLNKFAQ